jgi:carotenoid cleavage dioxygenase-like enzyme
MTGFQSLDEEVTARTLPVDGEIPSWLSGTLIRNGPGLFDVGETRVSHWFDGLALLRKYEFDDGDVRYTNRFLRTESYDDAMRGTATGQFATDTQGVRKVLRWLRRLGPPEPTDNANVHVARLDGEFVALTEVPRWVRFDGETLETDGEFVPRDLQEYHMTTAHLVADPVSGEHVGHALTFGRTHEYRLFRIPRGSTRREEITRIETDRPAYVHSVGVSQERIVLVETPLRIDIMGALSPFSEGFFDLLDWDESLDTRFYVVSRDDGDILTETTTDPFFTFHTVNAFDDGETVVVDLIEFEDAEIVDGLSLDRLEASGFDAVPPGRLVRYRVAPDGSVTRTRLYDGGTELPAVPPERKTRPYRYAYGQATDREGANGLVKVDTERGTAREFWERDLYVEEPCVVQHPDGDAEDDGIVLAPALDVAAGRSVLLCFDAATLAELGRAPLPHHLPFGFHGRFFRE